MANEPNTTSQTTRQEYAVILQARRELAELYRERTRRAEGKRLGWALRRLIASVAAGGILLCSLAATAEAPKPKRPALCIDGQAVSGNGMAVYVCRDGKRPRIFTRFIAVRFVDNEGKPATYTLGWNAPLVRGRTGGYAAEGTPKPRQADPSRM